MVAYSETIEVYDMKVGLHSKLNDYREIFMYQRSRSFFHHCPRSFIFLEVQLFFALKPPDRLKSIYKSLHETRRPKFIDTGEVT